MKLLCNKAAVEVKALGSLNSMDIQVNECKIYEKFLENQRTYIEEGATILTVK